MSEPTTPTTVTVSGPFVLDVQGGPEPAPPPSLRGVKKKYLVGVLYYGGIDREHDRCVQALRQHPYIGQILELTGCPYIDIGRSLIATAVLDNPEIGGLLFIDHDMVFDVHEVTKLIDSCEEHESVVGAAYSMRRPGKIIGAVDGSKISADEQVVFFEGGKVLPANYLGMGLTAIHRTVLERLVAHSQKLHEQNHERLREILSHVEVGDPQPPTLPERDLQRLTTGISDAPVVPFFSLLRRGGYYYGEDVSFCQRCHDAGVPVQLDTRVRVYHKGSYCYGLEDVGMEVPYCHQLVSRNVDEPKAAAAPANAAVRRALGAEAPAMEAPSP